jgi:arabinan endo-1,5-alpha-L-arabinosidase
MKNVVQWFSKLLAGAFFVCLPASSRAQMPVYGDYYAHDPSRIIKQGNSYYVYRTSQGIMGKTSTDLRNWTYSGQVFPGNPPAWTTNAVPGFAGFFWAPDVVLLNGTYYLYYAVSGFGYNVSAIGLVTTTNLATGPWTDQGPVIQSNTSNNYNCIDPCPLVDTNGTMWMTFGSYWNGIYLLQLDPATGKRITPNSPLTLLAYNSSIEASFLCQHGGYYYLFVNWDSCCQGIDSTYNIRVGRGTSVTGPYLDRNGMDLADNGGSMFLESTARFIGPGQAGIMNDNGTNWLTYHYYDGNNGGTATLGLGPLAWSADGWPLFTNDWSAFYTFNTDAREHLALYNGSLQNGAVITNEPGRGNVLSLDGVSQYVLLPDSVANAGTFAAWVKWNGGGDWQRIFDFGNGTTPYLFLTSRAGVIGKLRFAITTDGNGAEQTVDAPTALPTNSWCHVAVTLDGSKGLLYLDGNPVATNANLTLRPWQTLARSNYLGKSQFPPDPYFNGKIDSFRIFGRALGPSEIKDLAYAHPALAHRYSFTNNAWDSIGMAHGTLMGNASVTNGALVLSGTPGGYVNLPGGLVSGCSAVTIEFWATFGANGNWARVCDFGDLSGANGQNFLFFTPNNSSGGVQMGLSVAGGYASLVAPGPFDNRSLHVVCIADPTNNYTAIYTNGVLDVAQSNSLPALARVSAAWSFIGRSLFSADAWLNATIDEFRIYDGRLTPAEIAVNDKFGAATLALPVNLALSNAASNFTLTWPAYDAGFVAESSSALGGAANWAPVTATAILGNDRWNLTLPKTNTARFYRLRR